MVQPFLPSRLPAGSVDEDIKKSEQYLGDPNRPWWFKIAREVRECDERKVRDYKEDIDILLVFGALFSVVITTLVIESYRSLRQDPADLTVQILLQVSQQLSSYHVNGQFSNSTIPSFSLPSFTPSKPMIIVNIMWFGSLMISLMAASYGMLVKQWLREYSANCDASPLARLRIRCFRYPALAKWKVFEIVGILPLLLQLALALFFVGLCYFASSIHPAIQWTVIPLVVIWASLFILAAFAPIVSASCPYKITFLKDVMAQLRRAKLVMFNKVMHTSANTLSLVEEGDIAKNDTTDFNVLAQIDVTQADDSLISLALVDLSRQHQGPNLISFVFTIFNHRDSTITPANIDNLPNILYLSLPLLQAAYAAITEALRVEYEKTIASHGSQLVKWDEWVQDSFRLLLLMSRSTSQFNETLGNCLSIAHPDVLDSLMNPVMASVGWSEEQKTIFVKTVVQLISPSSMDSDDLRPLRLRNFSAQSWKCGMALFESSIFTGGTGTSSTQVWNQEVRFGFRGIFGQSQHVAPRDLCERIRTSFRSDELIEQLFSNISSSVICGHGRGIISYAFQIIQIHHEIPITLDLSFLPERSWFTVSRLFIDALKDECTKRTEDMEEGFKRDSLVLDAIYASLSTVQHPPRTDCLEVIALFYQIDPEMLSNSLMAHFSRSTSPPWTIAISTILRLLANSDVEQGDPWSIKLNFSTRTFYQVDLLANIVAKSLTALQASIRDHDPNTLKWVKWAVHILLSCVDVSDSFSGSTLSAIAKLTELNAHFIVRALPRNWQDRQHQVERLWKTILLMGNSRQAFIMQLWPRLWSPSDSIIPYHLTQMYATERRWTTTDAYLRTPPGLRSHHDVGNFIVCHLDHSRTLDYASRKKCVDELQFFLKSNTAWHAVHQIAAFLIQIGDPGWPEWMKGFIIEELANLQGTSELSDNLKKCLCYNATEFITLLALHDIEHLDRLPQNLLVHRKLVDHPLTSMFYTFLQHPEPLSSEAGESCLMRLLVNAEIDKPAWTFSSCDSYSSPRYACVSLALRILQYHLGSKDVQIPQKDIRFPLDLSQLKKEVWDDVSAAAAEVLNKDNLHDTDEHYFGGQKTFNIARMDAIMILLADSPHPFYNGLSYQVLEQETFFRWEDDLSVQSGTRHKLEKCRQSRIDERRRQGQHRSSVGTGTHDEASSLWQVIVTKSSQQVEEVYSQVKNDGDVQEDETMCGSNCIHRDGLGGEWNGTDPEEILENLEGRTSVDEDTYT